MIEQFFVVGAQRSGTTWLYHMLDQHPQIVMAKPMRPEPKYFLRENFCATGLPHYERTYYSRRNGVACGEKSTSYIESRTAAERIAAAYGEAHILFLLRDPIDRAVSNFRFSKRLGFETASLAEALTHEDERRENYDRNSVSASPFAYLRRGEYARYLQMYKEYFLPHRLHAFLTERLVGNTEGIRQVYAVLGVDTTFIPSGIGAVVNSADDEAAPVVTGPLLRRLQERFASSNEILTSEFGLDLSCWRNFQ